MVFVKYQVNSGKGHANVVMFVVVPILCNYRDNIVIEMICPYYPHYSFTHYLYPLSPRPSVCVVCI